jgi:hypothetical protein
MVDLIGLIVVGAVWRRGEIVMLSSIYQYSLSLSHDADLTR